MARILTGIQSTGTPHLGNILGAIKPAIDLANDPANDSYLFIADLHSLTQIKDAELLKNNTYAVAASWMACGLDVSRSVFYRQSDVPEVCELTWLLTTLTPMGLLERCHSYKDKLAKGLSPNHGLFAYPVLMAADILIYDSNVVPVGRDQKQHVEVTRDIAIKFNQAYGETFVIPEPKIRDSVAVVTGTDDQKMSKSYSNTIDIFGDEKLLRKTIMRLVMDSRPPEEPKPDADKNIAVQLLRLVAPEDVAADWEERLRAGGLGYGDLKKALFEHYWEYFAEARAKRAELESNLDHVNEVLMDGADKARTRATIVLDRARKNCGLA